MNQDSNTTNDSSARPRLSVVRGPNAPATPGEPATPAAPATPRLSFAPKKRADGSGDTPSPLPISNPASSANPTEPGEAPGAELKRPSSGVRLSAAGGTMPPLSPVTPGLTSVPFQNAATRSAAARARSHVPLLIALLVAVIIIGGESAYILIHQEEEVKENTAKPAVMVKGNAPTGQPITISDNGPAPTPAAVFLQTLDVSAVASGSRPRLYVSTQTFYIGDVIAPEYGLKWTQLNDQTHELEFVDKAGHRYLKKY